VIRRRQVGRPRRVTDADVAVILAWHATRETQRALATRLGLSVRIVSRVIQSQGLHYKTAGPRTDLPQEVSSVSAGDGVVAVDAAASGVAVEPHETE
jgi:hypothetical protein